MKFMNRTGSEPVNSAELHFPGLALNGIEVRRYLPVLSRFGS